MRQHDALLRTRQDDLVLADDRSAPHACETDRAIVAHARDAVAGTHRLVGEGDIATSRSCLTKQQRRAAWRIDFQPMVHLDDFDVVVGQRLRRLFYKRRKQCDPKAHIS